MTRAEHLARAFEYLETGDTALALASMTSDLGKHEETRALAAGALNTMLATLQEPEHAADIVRAWIEGIDA